VGVTCRAAAGWLVAFAALLVALPLAHQATDSHAVAMADGYYRTGALVFGGGHVVLPLLEEQVVEPGWVAPEDFLAGYGAAQAVPGPLFTFSAYLGAVQDPDPNGVPGAALALAAIFLPSFLLVFGTLPFWGVLRARPGAMAAMAGINAAVVGLLAAALYDPVFTEAVNGPVDLAIALAAFVALARFRVAPWVVVVACALIGAAAL
jgi:chromate transporter